MTFPALKVLTLGGLTVAGGATATGLLYTSSNKEELNSKKEVIPSSKEYKKPVVSKKACVVYVAKVIVESSNKKVTEIVQKIGEGEIENFLTSKGESFSKDVKEACKEGDKKNFVIGDKLSVFVYQEATGQKNWIYSAYLQKNWLTDNNVKQLAQDS